MADRSTSAVLKWALTGVGASPGANDWTEVALASDGATPLVGEIEVDGLIPAGQSRVLHVAYGGRQRAITLSEPAGPPLAPNPPVLTGGAALTLSLAGVLSGVGDGGSPVTAIEWETEGAAYSGSIPPASAGTPITIAAPDGTYRARARLVNAFGTGPWSELSAPATRTTAYLSWISNGGAARLNNLAPGVTSFLDSTGAAVACRVRLNPGGVTQTILLGTSNYHVRVLTNGQINVNWGNATVISWTLPGGAAAGQEASIFARYGANLSGVAGRTVEFWVDGVLRGSNSVALVAGAFTGAMFGASNSGGANQANFAIRTHLWLSRGAAFEYSDLFLPNNEPRDLGASGVVRGQTPFVYIRGEAGFDAGTNLGSGGNATPIGDWSTVP